MSIATLKDRLPAYAKDIKLNLEAVLTEEGAPGLSASQLWGCALAIAITLKDADLLAAVETEAATHLSETEQAAARTAASLMGMTNVYYRTLHMLKDQTYQTMPASLRMNGLKTHGADQASFDLWAFAASVIGQCSGCVNAHDSACRKLGISAQGLQSAIRIAAVLNATSVVLATERASATQAAAAA